MTSFPLKAVTVRAVSHSSRSGGSSECYVCVSEPAKLLPGNSRSLVDITQSRASILMATDITQPLLDGAVGTHSVNNITLLRALPGRVINQVRHPENKLMEQK